MIVRILLLITLICVPGSIARGQKIPEDRYENAADFVIASYIKSYITVKYDGEPTWNKDDNKSSWNDLKNNSIENPFSNSQLVRFIKNLKGEKRYENSRENLQKKVDTFYKTLISKRTKVLDIENLIKVKGVYKSFLGNLNPRIQLEQALIAAYKNSAKSPDVTREEIMAEKYKSVKPKTDIKEQKHSEGLNAESKSVGSSKYTVSNSRGFSISPFIFGVLVGIGGCGLLYWFVMRKSAVDKPSKDNRDYLVSKDKRIKELENKVKTYEGDLEEKSCKINELEHELQESRNSLARVGSNKYNESTQLKPTIKAEHLPRTNTIYADTIVDDFFHKTSYQPNSDTIYELILENDKVAQYTVFMGAKSRIVARPTFLDGNDKQVLNITQQIEVSEVGSAKKEMDGRWRITKKMRLTIH